MPSDKFETDEQTSHPFDCQPPRWLPKVSTSADLGYLDFYPPCPGQDEDILSESNVKHGFVSGYPQVNAETFSAQSILNIEDVTLSKLETLINEVFARQTDSIPAIPPSTFRIPARVTLNDTKRSAWFADLADPDVPLYKLGKSVPHGAKGHDLLDLLHSYSVAIPRAVWFLRVFGANETAGLRNKSCYNPMQHSLDWANVITSYLKKQLAEIALPSAPRLGLNIKQTFKGVLSDLDARERWISRFSYCLKLLRSFYTEGMVDNQAFLTWIIQQQGTCNLAQTGFITRLADEYLEDFVSSRALTRPFVDACILKLSEIRCSARELLRDTEQLLRTILQRLCLAAPDAFISPRTWRIQSSLIQDVLGISHNSTSEKYVEESILLDNISDIKRRNQAMLHDNLPVRQVSRLERAAADVKLLNSISASTNLSSLCFFSNSPDQAGDSFTEKIGLLLSWSVTPLQYGNHRIFAAVSLISHWKDREYHRVGSAGDPLQDEMFEWLDSSETAGQSDLLRSISLLFGSLIDRGLFSYSNYIQRLIARGEMGLLFFDDHTESRHRKFLRWLPLSKPTPALLNQRKIALYGTRTRVIPEDTNERIMKNELQAALPDLMMESTSSGTNFSVYNSSNEPSYEGDASAISSSTICKICSTLITSPCFEQIKILRQWLLPIWQRGFSTSTIVTNQTSLLNAYSLSINIMELVRDFQTIFDLTLLLLAHSSTVEVLNAVICTLQRFASIWSCMGNVSEIVTSLEVAHQIWKAKGVQFRPLLSLLLELDDNYHLSISSRNRIKADISAFTMALQPLVSSVDVVPDELPEILLLVDDPDIDAPSLLANSLWIKYRKTSDWALKVWKNSVQSLSRLPLLDNRKRQAGALRYGIFLRHIDRHLPFGLDREVTRWLLQPGRPAGFSYDLWDAFSVMLLYLSLHGALRTTTILSGLVYPIWREVAKLSAEDRCIFQQLRSANGLCRRLLVSDEINVDGIPPTNTIELQSIQTRREEAYHSSQFPLLANVVPLLIMVELNHFLPEDLRADSSSLRHSISLNHSFRQEAFRNLEAVRDAFEQVLLSADSQDRHLIKYTISGLHMLLSDAAVEIDISECPSTTFILNPWNVFPTMVEVQFVLKRISHLNTAWTGAVNLDRLIEVLFHHTTVADAFYFADVLQGVDSNIVAKFMNNGFICLTQVLQRSSPLGPEGLRQASDLLHFLVHIAEPMRHDSDPSLSLEPSIQEEFLDTLASNISLSESIITSVCDVDNQYLEDERVAFILRLLHLALAFHVVGSSKARESLGKISSSLFKLSLTYGTSSLSLATYPLIIDSLYYILDEITSDFRVTPYDPFRGYPSFSSSELPQCLPADYRQQLMSLLPHLSTTTKASNLVISARNPNSQTVHQEMPVLNRPWEWIENLGEQPLVDRKGEFDHHESERFRARYSIKNSGSLSLDIFNAQFTGDVILQPGTQERNTQIFEKCLSSETLFQRSWREGRTAPEVTYIDDKEVINNHQQIVSKIEERQSSKFSPTPSLTSHSSTHTSGGSAGESPGQETCMQNLNLSGSAGKMTDSRMGSSRSPNKRRVLCSGDEAETEANPITGKVKKPRRQASSKTSMRKK